HIQNLQTYKGCDSTVNLILTINQPAITNLTAEICQGETYTLNGFNVNTSGLHIQNLQTYKGCDSTVNLTLTVNQPAITNLIAEICQGETYTLNGFNTSTAGIYNLNLQTYKGCDSIVTLNLTVNELITPTNLVLDNIANYFEFSWQGNGESYVIYRNNDSIATITGTIYQDTNVVVGTNYCYKVKALNSTCESELSEGICQIFSGLNDIKNNKISATLYPNPTDNKAILEIEGLTNQYDVIVYDLHGRTIKSYRLNLGEKKLEIDVKGFANGVYNIKIVNDKNSITKKLIVR
ncbi:MAG: T9SS type A sorting domain-containing protein, partial [Bacteroidales bacterium]